MISNSVCFVVNAAYVVTDYSERTAQLFGLSRTHHPPGTFRCFEMFKLTTTDFTELCTNPCDLMRSCVGSPPVPPSFDIYCVAHHTTLMTLRFVVLEQPVFQLLHMLSAQASPRALPPWPLSPRQNEVLRGLATGHNVDEIARALNISRYTVRTHIRMLCEALNVHSQREAIITYLRRFAGTEDQ